MPVVTVLTCPVCGAPIGADDGRCSYCGSVVVIHTDHPRLEPWRLNKAVIDERIAGHREALRRDNTDAKARFGLGVAYFNLGLLEEAADELAQAARLTPESAQMQTQLGVVLADPAELGKLPSDQAAWDRAERTLLLQPDLTDALLLKARLQMERGDEAGATDTLRRVAAAEPTVGAPKLVASLLARAQSQLDQGDWARAVEAWREAAQFDADAVRSPVSAFLAAHQALLGRVPIHRSEEHDGDGSLRFDERPARRRWPRSLGWALAAAFVCLVLAVIFAVLTPTDNNGEAELGSAAGVAFTVTCFGVLVTPVAVVLFRWKYAGGVHISPGISRAARGQFRSQLLAGTTDTVSPLLHAADAVADALTVSDRQGARRRTR